MGHTLVDATTPSASVLIINPNAEEVVLPCGSYIGDLVPVLSAGDNDRETPGIRGGHCPGGRTLPWEIPVVNPCVKDCSSSE